ncbi:tape measure protein [Gordonia phage Howe]|uniref:Tape measure protein n=1 Tax=Gordonia phage Howe TaxID=1777061 RepID=A0A0U4JCZ4_9CAUD|nr:tail length tape measure protein [Gordonia phage Howe]ALY07652.1 tape measure protein [Gordonia phage Howe]QYC54419.1 tape measure protein [Gordonia phage Shlim410]
MRVLLAIIVADLIAQLRVQDSGVEQSLDRTRSNLQQVGRQAENTGRATQQMSSASAAAYSRAQAASTRLRMAEQQLADARRAGNTPTQRLMSLEARVHSARAGAITAAQRYASSQNQIAQANQNVERSNRAVERSSNSVVAAAGRARGALEMAGVGVGLAAVVEGMKRAVFAASDLAESTNAVDVSFGSSAQKVKDWAATAAQAIGQSNVEAREGASTMALYGKQANLSGDSLANFSIKMTTLASDMASFRNTSPEQAVEALGAAFRGESDPIEAYGVLLNEATIKNQAMKDGLVASTSDALTPAIRVQAVYNAILEQTSIMQGDFGNTSDSMANRLRILRASATNAAAGIGDKLMPIANGFITLLEGPGMAAFQGAGSALGAIGSVASMVGAAFGDLPGPIQSAIMAVVAMRIAQRLLGGQMQSLQQRVAGVGGVWQGYSQRVANVQRAAAITGQSMGRLQASTIAMSQTVRNTSPTLMSMQAAFLRASSGASTMPRTAGAFSAATAGMAAGARGLIGALGGPWGLAIMGATIALGAFIKKKQEDKQKSQEAAAQTESWADQIGRAGGKITSALRTDVLKQADDDTKKLAVSNKTLAQTMTDLGFSNKDTVDTILKQGDAYERVRNRLIAMQNDRENSDQDTRASAYDARLELERLAKQADDAKTKAQRLAQANGDMRVSFDKNNTAVGAMTEAMTEFEESTDGAASKVDKLAKALSQLNSDGQTEEEAQQSWSDSIRDLAKALGEAGTAAVLANGKIDFTTEKGSALQDAVQKQAEAFNQVAAAAFEAARAQGKSIPEAVELARTKLVEQRKALIDSLTAQGLSADAARRLADAYGLIPNLVATNLNVVGLDEANAGIGTLLVQLNTLPREKPVSVTAPGGQQAFDLLRSIGAQIRVDNRKNIVVDAPLAPEVLDTLHRLGLAVRTNNGKTIIVTDNGTAAVVQRNIDAIRGHQVRMTVTYVDAAGREVRGIDPSTGGIPLKPEYFKELKPKGKATGGPIVGPGTGTSDDVPLWGSNGEFMMQAAAVKRYGLSFMHAVNAQRLATGGPVGSGPAGGDAAAVSDPGTATVAVPGMGLPDALGQVAAVVSQVKDAQLDPAMTEATAGVTEYGLATAEQTAAVQAAWTATGAAVTTAAGNVIGPAVRGVGQVSQSTVAGLVVPALAGMRSNIAATAMGVQSAATGQINPAIASVGSTVQGVHAGTVDPVLAAMRGAVGNTAASFGTGASAIAAQWNSVREATAAPVRFTIGTVFNNGLVGMWNSVADLIGTSKMNPYPIGFATGGVLPGYTPGRDVHQFASPTGGRLALSGGEAIMRPEWTRAVGGPNAVNRMNALARSGQLRRVKGTDQYLGGDMAFASGGTIQGGSSITSEIQRTMWDAVRTAFPNVVLTSGTRYADVGSGFDNHMGQRALDLAGPMPEIARWIYQLNRTQPVEELIHWPLQGWQNLKSGSPLDYGAGTNADHVDHVHWAMAAMRSVAGRLVSMAGGSGGPAIQKSMSQIIAETLNPLRAQVEKSMAGAAFGGQMGQLPRGVFTTMQQAMTARLRDLATKYMGPAIGGGADVERWRPMVIAALRRNGFEPNKRNQDLMLAQIGSESGGNPGVVQGVQDVNSGGNEAVGLLQVTPGTFATYRDPSLSDNRSDPWANMNAALRYYRARYGDDLGAMWGKGHGYANGGTIPGSGNRDTVPILTTPGEEVIRKGPAEKNRPLLKKINEGGDVRVYVTNWPAGTSYSSTAVPAVPADPNADPMVDPALTITDPTAVEPAVSPSERSAAENLVANAKRKHTEAVNKQRLAELKLAEIQGNPKAKASQREAAEQAVAKAKNDVIAATEKQRLAEQKLAETVSSGATATPGMPGATGAPTGPPTAFELKLRNPFQPFWWRGEKEYQERIIQRARELEQAQNELNGSGSGSGSGTSLSAVLGSENAVAERKRVLEEAEGKLRIAQMKLQEVQGSKNPKPSQIESARQAITRAENDVTKAREDLAVAEQKLAENQAKPIKQPGITKMWVGGTVPGTGISDTVPALLTPGEEVTRRAMAIKYRRLLKAINADKVGRYASGGTAGFGGYSADDSDYMKPTSLYDWLALGVGGASSVAGMAAPYAQMLLTGQVDLGNAMPQFDTGANDPTGGFANSIISDFASQISQQLNELIRAVKEGQDIHVKVENDQSPSAAGLVGMAMGV